MNFVQPEKEFNMNPYLHIDAHKRQNSLMLKRTNTQWSLSDQGKVIFSAPFRRLQSKAQIFPLEQNASVRSRLTHSLEVANVGKYIAGKINEMFRASKYYEECTDYEDYSFAFSVFSETACLIHDIGNPPFGHFGETAIKSWFKSNGKTIFETSVDNTSTHLKSTSKFSNNQSNKDFVAPNIKYEYSDFVCHDFENFDGNAQGLRVVCRLQVDFKLNGLNLTLTQLAGTMKYTASSNQINSDQAFSKKAGYFCTERDVIKDLRKTMYGDKDSLIRHPIAFVMEAADDIAYCISDMEDSVEKNIISIQLLRERLKEIFYYKCDSEPYNINRTKAEEFFDQIMHVIPEEDSLYPPFTTWRVNHIRKLVEHAAGVFMENIDSINKGEFKSSLICSPSIEHAWLKSLKAFSEENVYTHSSVVDPELAGLTIISGILDSFRPLLELEFSSFNKLVEQVKPTINEPELSIQTLLLSKIPDNYIKAYKAALQRIGDESCEMGAGPNYYTKEWIIRTHLILDHVSSMTDDYALRTFRNFAGQSSNTF